MCFPKMYTGLGCANLKSGISEIFKKEALGNTGAFSSFLSLEGKHWHPNTHDKHRLKQMHEHTMLAVLRKRSDTDFTQREDSG